jgi:hypothetical protein
MLRHAQHTFLADGMARIGVSDTYRRYTWRSRTDAQKVNAAYKRDFGPKQPAAQ